MKYFPPVDDLDKRSSTNTMDHGFVMCSIMIIPSYKGDYIVTIAKDLIRLRNELSPTINTLVKITRITSEEWDLI